MTAPAVTVRGTPTGAMLLDGHPTLFAFSLNPTIQIWEKASKVPGVDGGAKINITTFWNQSVETFAGRKLKTITDGEGTCAYDPANLPAILSLINNFNGAFTAHHPDGSGHSYWGGLSMFEPNENKEGEQPTAKFKLVATNYDPVNHTEELPVYTASAGT